MTRPARVACLAAVIAAASLVAASPARAAPDYGGKRISIKGAAAPGPGKFDRLWVRRYGPRNAKFVLVLLAGSPSGQGNYRFLAPALAGLVPGLSVWTVDRRENAFEDTRGFRGRSTDAALGYYSGLGKINSHSFTPVRDADVPFTHDWGVAVEFNDVRRVILTAKRGGRKVILGGHSMGAAATPAYAAWDFNGHPGYKDLVGLVQIDGAMLGAFDSALAGTPFRHPYTSATEARTALQEFRAKTPFGFAGTPIPVPLWTVGVAPELACKLAVEKAQEPSVLQGLLDLVPDGLLPHGLVPKFRVTNEALAGFLVEHSGVAAVKARLGRLASRGDPRPWVNGPFSSVPRACKTFTEEPGNGMEWYYPLRIDIDLLNGMQSLEPTAVTREMGLRPKYLHQVDLPLYAFETSLSHGGVLKGTRRFIKRSRVRHFTLAADEQMGHLDPLLDNPSRNKFVKTVVPFLRGIVSQTSAR